MAQLWGGRFTKETDQLVYRFNASIAFDRKFYKQDIEGSIAHVGMLGRQGILTREEAGQMLRELQRILSQLEDGTLEISDQYEDIHSFVYPYGSRSDGRSVKGIAGDDLNDYESAYGDDYARLYPSAKSAAGNAGASYGRIF